MPLLRINSSINGDNSVTRDLVDRIVARLDDPDIVSRDLARDPLPQIDGDWFAAQSTAPEARTAEQAALLTLSDRLVAEVMAADTVVIGAPVYNFAIPASLKAWIDLLARNGVTFRYTEAGPEGLVKGKRIIVALASGGTPLGSEADFASGYLRFVFGFLGMTDVTLIAADALATEPEATRARAIARVEGLGSRAAA